MNRELFGDPNHYYSKVPIHENKPSKTWETPLEKRIRQILSSAQTDVKKRVEQTCKQANMAIREYLRSETALKLTQADKRQAVPYQVIDGIPLSLAEKLEALPDPILLLLLQKRQLVAEGEIALNFVINQYQEIAKVVPPERDLQNDLKSSGEYFRNILKAIDDLKLPDMIKEIKEDVLGAYFFYVPMIEIYWMPVGLIAGILNVPIEDLSFVVLAHELAHAYSHLGLDIDGAKWETRTFAAANIKIVEGLAQYYTESICKKYVGRQPRVMEAFEKLLKNQSAPYTHFRSWDINQASEVVRFAMIAARTNSITKHEKFLEEMAAIKQKISIKNTQKSLLFTQ